MITKVLRNGILAGIIETGNILDPAAVFVGVFSAIVDSGINTVLADITRPSPAAFDLVAVAAWGTPHDMIDGRRAVDGPLVAFSPASDVDATTVLGWYLASDDTGGNLLQFGYFAAPIPLPDENAQVSIVPRVTVDPDGRWDATIYFNG